MVRPNETRPRRVRSGPSPKERDLQLGVTKRALNESWHVRRGALVQGQSWGFDIRVRTRTGFEVSFVVVIGFLSHGHTKDESQKGDVSHYEAYRRMSVGLWGTVVQQRTDLESRNEL